MPRLLAIGDIHGCINALTTLFQFAKISTNDQVVTLGDYVDRGPDSCAVIDWLIHWNSRGNLVSLRGNHEIMMLESRHKKESFQDWMASGGEATMQSYSPFPGTPGKFPDVPDEHWQFLEATRAYHETDHHFFVHANALPDYELASQPDFILYWERFNDPPRHQSGKIMICGHSSQRSGLPLFNDNAICIDTWAYGSGWLTCLDVSARRIYQANEAGETRTMWLDETN